MCVYNHSSCYVASILFPGINFIVVKHASFFFFFFFSFSFFASFFRQKYIQTKFTFNTILYRFATPQYFISV